MELLSWGVLDEGSADFLSKAPEQHAKEIVASLGPDVRNPSAFVTRRLKELRSEADGARRAEAPAPVEQLVVHHKGVPRPLPWLCKEQAAEQLASWGLLDEGSADFLTKAPEHEAKQIVACLGPDVRNPSAFVTRKLKELFREGPPAADAPAAEVLAVHHNGAPLSLRWLSKEQALLDLVRWGVLDEGSADFLMKAPEQEAKDIVACLGPDVRNPSAFVTRKMKERRGGAMQLEQAEPLAAAAWLPLEQLVGQLVGQGILDEGSASFLGRVPEQVARDILASLGPDVRNPSAFVTTKVKAALEGDAPHRVVEAPMVPASGLQEEQLVTVYHGGSRMTLPWHSQVQALRDLVAGGVLDQRSADFLAKIPEKAAKDIVGALGPDVRNPSAFVTKEARKWQS